MQQKKNGTSKKACQALNDVSWKAKEITRDVERMGKAFLCEDPYGDHEGDETAMTHEEWLRDEEIEKRYRRCKKCK